MKPFHVYFLFLFHLKPKSLIISIWTISLPLLRVEALVRSNYSADRLNCTNFSRQQQPSWCHGRKYGITSDSTAFRCSKPPLEHMAKRCRKNKMFSKRIQKFKLYIIIHVSLVK